MNPFDILKNLDIESLKKKSQEMMNQVKDITVTGVSGGGFVSVIINGDFNIISINYEDNDFIKQDINTFRDLIISAHNDAIVKMKDELKKKFSSNFIPGLF